jgi:hypothetical protein
MPVLPADGGKELRRGQSLKASGEAVNQRLPNLLPSDRGIMKAFRATPVFVLLVLAATPVSAQMGGPDATTPNAGTITSSVTEILSLATLGMVRTRQDAAQVTRNGTDYRVRLPLSGFSAPADAAVDAVVHPLDGGMLDIASMTFPSAGTIETAATKAGTGRVVFSIGEQTIRGQFDPGLIRPSAFAADFANLRMRSDQGDHSSEQVFERFAVDGTLSAETTSQLNFASRSKATNWDLTARAPNGVETRSLVRKLSGHFAVEGLDRAQGIRLLAAARALLAGTQAPAAGQPSGIPPVQRQDLHALVDAVSGLLTRFEADDTLDDIGFSVGPANSGTIGHMRVNMAGDALKERLNARMDIVMDEFTMTTLSAETAAYVPRHVDMKSVLAGVRTGSLMALLRAAIEPNADPAALQAQVSALLGDAGARAGIESLTFDSGPMRVTGSMRIVPRPNGQLGVEIHMAATGVDTLITEAQGKPALQQALPVMFMAKGMGRPQGDAIVWDIAFGGGRLTVNGVPFGQPSASNR